MSLFPAYLSARRRRQEPPPAAVEADDTDSRPVFELVPPNAADDSDGADDTGPKAVTTSSRNVHTIGVSDLSRLSIDDDGRLYWDGKPVEVRRRILMSRPQVVGASLVAAFVVMGALAAVLQGTVAARDWACRLGWTQSHCTLPGVQPRSISDIPA